LTEAEEFDKIYKLEVLPIPTNLEYQAFSQTSLVKVEAKDEQGLPLYLLHRRMMPGQAGLLEASKITQMWSS
jgi:preprotein translocase subunit SecA